MYLHGGRLLIKSTWRVRTVPLAQVRNFAVGGTTGAIPVIPFACLAMELTDGNALLLKESKTFSRRRTASAVDGATRLLAPDTGTGQGPIQMSWEWVACRRRQRHHRTGRGSVLSTVRGVVAILVVVAAAGCADESIRIDTAMPRALNDRVIDVFTTSACGDIRVEVDEDDDDVTLRAYNDTPGDDCGFAEGVAGF